jgi:hypothetical protein
MKRWFYPGMLLLALAFFAYLMIRLTLPYTAMRSNTGFLHTKLTIYHLLHWRFSFYIQIFISCLVLLAGFTQFAPRLLIRYPRLHRSMGWIYLVIVTVVSGPAAFVLALYANGGWGARISFALLAALWIGSTAIAGYYAFRRRFTLHGKFMFRSYALTLSAITLRVYTLLMDWLLLPIHPREVYILSAWLSWIPNLLFAEMLIRKGWVEKLYPRLA